jgi:hypothetical protein
MNYILYVHDTGDKPVWDNYAEPQAMQRQVAKELGELISDYTMGLVTVDLEPDAIPRDYGSHLFQVMCARCLEEPFDAADECPEVGDDEEATETLLRELT